MDKKHIDSEHVVDRYVRGSLTSEELTAFEIYMLDHPEIIREIELSKGFREGILRLGDELRSTDSPPDEPKARRNLFLSREYAVAATVLLAICVFLLVSLLNQTKDLRTEIAELSSPTALSDDFWLESMRSGKGPQFQLSEDRALVLRVDVGPSVADHYSVVLEGSQSGYYWTKSGLAADSEQSIRLQIAAIPPDQYRLSVTKSDEQDSFIVHEFELTISGE